MKSLSLIRIINLLNQKNGSRKRGRSEMIGATSEEAATARKIATDALIPKALKHLSPEVMLFLLLIEQMVSQACKKEEIKRSDFRFGFQEARSYTGWPSSLVKNSLQELVEANCLSVGKGSKDSSIVYELLYDDAKHRKRSYAEDFIRKKKMSYTIFKCDWSCTQASN